MTVLFVLGCAVIVLGMGFGIRLSKRIEISRTLSPEHRSVPNDAARQVFQEFYNQYSRRGNEVVSRVNEISRSSKNRSNLDIIYGSALNVNFRDDDEISNVVDVYEKPLIFKRPATKLQEYQGLKQ